MRFIVCLLCLCLILPAAAYDCRDWSNTPNPSWADYTFDGKVKSITLVKINGQFLEEQVVFEVAKVYKGEKKKTVAVRTVSLGYGDGIGYPFLCGEMYHVNAIRKKLSDGPREVLGLYTDRCMHVRPLSSKTQDADDVERILLSNPPAASKAEQDKLLKKMDCPAK